MQPRQLVCRLRLWRNLSVPNPSEARDARENDCEPAYHRRCGAGAEGLVWLATFSQKFPTSRVQIAVRYSERPESRVTSHVKTLGRHDTGERFPRRDRRIVGGTGKLPRCNDGGFGTKPECRLVRSHGGDQGSSRRRLNVNARCFHAVLQWIRVTTVSSARGSGCWHTIKS